MKYPFNKLYFTYVVNYHYKYCHCKLEINKLCFCHLLLSKKSMICTTVHLLQRDKLYKLAKLKTMAVFLHTGSQVLIVFVNRGTSSCTSTKAPCICPVLQNHRSKDKYYNFIPGLLPHQFGKHH